jgi:hypothetical protein
MLRSPGWVGAACSLLLLATCAFEPDEENAWRSGDEPDESSTTAADEPDTPSEDPVEPDPPAPQPTCAGEDCCPAGMETVLVSEAADEIETDADGKCLLLMEGHDQVVDTSKGSFVLAGPGDDSVEVDGAAVVLGGPGADSMIAHAGGTELIGGAGADSIETGDGHHVIVPGTGADTVKAGAGSVVVQVLDACELEAGESLEAAGTADTLVIPVAFDSLAEMGVEVQGFEHVVVTGATCLSECATEDCLAGEGAVP